MRDGSGVVERALGDTSDQVDVLKAFVMLRGPLCRETEVVMPIP